MINNNTILSVAKESILAQSNALQNIASLITDSFAKAIHIIEACKGRVVISGIGKSGIVAQKIVATLNSTGTPSLYMHAADAIHGDLGMVQPNDIMLIISKSGESEEIRFLTQLVKKFGNPIIAICGNENSYLAKESDIFLNTYVEQEVCPNNLAPTTSTTAQMVMGDALAVCMLQLKGFGAEDFAKFHPGGALGKQLYVTVKDLCKKNPVPIVLVDANINDVIISMTSARLGATAVVNENNKVLGIITDGDLRRMLQNKKDTTLLSAKDIMTASPKSITDTAMAVDALAVMRANNILQLIIVNSANDIVGFVHLHDILREGIV